MQLRTVLAVLVILALVLSLLVLVGCGKKKEADTGAGPAAGPAGGTEAAGPTGDAPPPGAGPPGGAPAAGGPPGGGPPGGAHPSGGPPSGGPPSGASPGGGNAAALAEEGMNLKRMGQSDEAVAKFREALTADPKHEAALYGLAWTLAGQGKKAEAAGYFQQVVQVTTNPTHKDEAKKALQRLGG